MKPPKLSTTLTMIVAFIVLTAVTAVVIERSYALSRETRDLDSAWRFHRDVCLKIPEGRFTEDRARAVRGTVRDAEGRPVPGALVRCLPLTSLMKLARIAPPNLAAWSGLVEAETRTDADGRYEFFHFAEGSRTVCVSASGLAPAVQGPIVVQDGSGGRIDLTLDAPETLHIRLKETDGSPRRVTLVPHRWWPELVSHDVAAGVSEVEIAGLGGPYRQGLVLLSGPDGPTTGDVAGSFDLDRSREVTVSCAASIPAPTIPEAACVDSWGSGVSEASRSFFSMLSPIALFWRASQAPSNPGESTYTLQHLNGSGAAGVLRGYTRGAFLPVLIESRVGGAWLGWTSEASEFELGGLPGGIYRARALDAFGRVSFARGSVVQSSGVSEFKTAFGTQIDLDKSLSREVMGVVCWEDGQPVEDAEVFFQDAVSFRRFIQRAQTDRNGFFRIANVPGNASYFAFARPPKEENAIKVLIFPEVDSSRRETWLDLRLSPHRVIGRFHGGGSDSHLELVSEEPEGRSRVVWSFSPDKDGQFRVANVPHGRYVVRESTGGVVAKPSSLPCPVETEIESFVQWPESKQFGLPTGPLR